MKRTMHQPWHCIVYGHWCGCVEEGPGPHSSSAAAVAQLSGLGGGLLFSKRASMCMQNMWSASAFADPALGCTT